MSSQLASRLDVPYGTRPSSPRPERPIVPALDGLRACAILLVLLTDLWTYPSGHTTLNLIAATGWSGVDLFFVLSGFLITGILWDTRDDGRYYRNFLARRALRIVPLYYLVLFVAFVALPLREATPELLRAREDWWLYATFLGNIPLAAGRGGQLFLIDILWSVSVEVQFYLIWPWVVRKLTAPRLVTLCATLLVATLLLRTVARVALDVDTRWLYMLPIYRADAFAAGALVAMLTRTQLVHPATLRRIALGLVAVLVPVIVTLVLRDRFHRFSVLADTVGYSLLALLAAAAVVLALEPGRVSRALLTTRPMRHIGQVSYGLYLYHLLGLMIGGMLLARVTGLSFDAEAGLAPAVLQLVVISLGTLVVAGLSHRVVEQPILRLKRHFAPSQDEPALAIQPVA